ncbi:MAG: TIGR02147 family protein [Deltaproteobacteria bacterium]|nr:TIGR02147 family protein [Deltaproteobacteria bacterium]
MQIQSIQDFNDYRPWLEYELTKRTQKNPHYSLRAFSKTLKMSVAQLSRILSGTRPLTLKASEAITEALALSPEEKNHLIQLIITKGQRQHSSSTQKRSHASTNKDTFLDLSIDAFTTISKWYHYAITELTFLKAFQSDPIWIAKILGINANEARAAIGRLKRLGILEEKKGRLTKASKPLTTTQDIPSAAIRSFHKEVLEKAILSLEQHEVHERDMSSMVMAADPKNIKTAKEKIKKFRRSLCKFLESGKPSRIYTLGIQLFPLSKGDNT